MNDFSISMALVDYIPVICFAIASVILLRDLYRKMSKGAFALFSAGVIDVTLAGALKATWKLLYAAGVCNFEALDHMFFPVQSIGFLLAGIGILAMLVHKQTGASLTKPSPWMFQKALFGSDFPNARILSEDYDKERIQTTLIVGDAGADMAAAIAMGADFCAVLTGAHGQNGRPLFEKDARFILDDVSFITKDM